jgi:2-polyprenyl-6-methoxyphenol hydroxylase-like FAD-dependent oxidoreductase
MRANYMCYRGLDDPWILKLRKDPLAALTEIMPRLEKTIGAFAVTGQMRIRPADLYTTDNVNQPGIVLIGDAFSTSCPAAGTGSGKALTDVVTLCGTHIPAWLATEGMGTEKIAAFYADPEKVAYDTYSIRRAYDLRSQSIDTSPKWIARRWGVFAIRTLGGAVRRIADRLHLGTASHGTPKAKHV